MAEEQTFTQQDLVLDINSRVRSLEGRYNILRDRVLIVNNNMISEHKKVSSEARALDEDVKDVKSEIFKLKEVIRHLIEELDNLARKEDVKFLEKYINFWNPLKLTTETDVIRLIEDYNERKLENKITHKKNKGE